MRAFVRQVLPDRPILAAVVALMVILAIPATALASPPWRVTRMPASVNSGEVTEVWLMITLQSILPVDVIGCVTVAVDPAFSVAAPRVIGTPIGKSWLYVPPPTAGVVTFAAVAGNDRLAGNPLVYESVIIGITVNGTVDGTYSWVVAAYANKNCSSTKLGQQSITVSIVGGSPPTPTPTPMPSPTPSLTPTPTPSLTPSPTSPATPTPRPVPILTPRPGASATQPPSGSIAPSAASSPDATSPRPTGSVDPGSTLIPAAVIDTANPSERPGTGPVQGGIAFQVPTSPNGTVDVASVQLAAAVIGSLGIFRWAVPGALLSIPGLLIVLLTILVQAGGGLLWLPIVRRKLGTQRAKPRSTRTRQV